MSLWATKSISVLRAEADADAERSLRRHLGALNLITLGIGAIIGAGIFVLTGQAAALYAGPAVPLSFILRSEERRGGKEGRSRWSPYHLKKKKKQKRVNTS